MSRFRIRPLAVVAALFMVSGLALMIGSLTIDERRPSTTVSASTGVVPTLPPSPAPESASGSTRTPEASDPDATRLLERALDASRSLSYAGVKQVSRWDSGEASSVVITVENDPGRGTYVSVGDPVDADEGGSPVSVESGTSDESGMLETLLSNYTLATAGTANVADREAQVVEASRADGTLAARFWIDDETSLVLRRVLVDAEGRKLESSSFLKVELEPASTPMSSSTARPTPTTWERVEDDELDDLRGEGWPVIDELDAGMELYEVRRQGTSTSKLVQLSYTDGLVSMSVFVQQGRLDRSALDGYAAADLAGGEVWVRSAPTSFVVWEASAPAGSDTDAATDIVVSVTSDSPSAPIGAVVRALPPRAAAEGGVGDRLSRGVERVTSWFDPSE